MTFTTDSYSVPEPDAPNKFGLAVRPTDREQLSFIPNGNQTVHVLRNRFIPTNRNLMRIVAATSTIDRRLRGTSNVYFNWLMLSS